MSKKKHPEHVNHERWLVSYADFITLLFAFFVVLFASGQADKHKQVKLAKAMQTAFDHNGIFEQHADTPPLSDAGSANAGAIPTPLALPLPTAAEQTAFANATAQRIHQVMRVQVAERHVEEGAVSVRPIQDGVAVSLREAGFFASGSADVRQSSLDTLKAIIAALPRRPMRVEGHTDNVPIHNAQFATNWELSTARAAGIARMLIDEGAVSPKELSAAGFAEFRPLASNDTEQGRTQNRRVDIVLLRPASGTN